MLAIGDPDGSLPESRAEAKAVGSEVLLGKDALSNAFVSVKRRRAVHFACHGTIDAEHPSRSALALADGPWTLLDVFGFKLDRVEGPDPGECRSQAL